jgi:hypothetical protein
MAPADRTGCDVLRDVWEAGEAWCAVLSLHGDLDAAEWAELIGDGDSAGAGEAPADAQTVRPHHSTRGGPHE